MPAGVPIPPIDVTMLPMHTQEFLALEQSKDKGLSQGPRPTGHKVVKEEYCPGFKGARSSQSHYNLNRDPMCRLSDYQQTSWNLTRSTM